MGERNAALFPPQVSGKKVADIENSFYLCTVKTKTKLDRPEKQGVSNLSLQNQVDKPGSNASLKL
jgi:hypothetical protein